MKINEGFAIAFKNLPAYIVKVPAIHKDTPYIQALGKTPSGLFIITSAHNGLRAGYLASFVQQASFEPVIFSVACHPDRYPYRLMLESGKFGISIIPQDDTILMKTFAKGHGPEEDLIMDVEHEDVEGVPLLKNSIGGAVFDVIEIVQPGDHMIVFGQVMDGRLYQGEKEPWVHVRKHALTY